jgi:hypothetical protein
MSKSKSSGKKRQLDAGSNLQWERAIADSEKLIHDYQDQIDLLKASVRSFKNLRDRGAPFPNIPDAAKSKAA